VKCYSGLNPAGDAKFAQDVRHVHAGRFLTYVKGSGDLGVGQAIAEQPDDLEFPTSQADRIRIWRPGSRFGQVKASPAGEGGDLGVHRHGAESACGRLGFPYS
jgi:hypothetical protein